MIELEAIHQRIFNYFDNIFLTNKSEFNFDSNSSFSFIVDRQTSAPRPSVKTLLEYRIESNEPWGNSASCDSPGRNENTQKEFVDIRRKLHVIVNILSKKKGDAKNAFNFIIGIRHTTRGYNASYSLDYDFCLPLHRIDQPYRDLSSLENKAWTERIEIDFHFNYQDKIILSENAPYIPAPLTIETVKDRIDYEIEFKKET